MQKRTSRAAAGIVQEAYLGGELFYCWQNVRQHKRASLHSPQVVFLLAMMIVCIARGRDRYWR